MIELTDVTKRYGSTTVVDHVSFTAVPGRVTGLLGPNGAGKSTSLRVLLGIDRATAGHATILGRRYRDLARPLTRVGAMLDGAGPLPERRGIDHLRWVARSNRIPASRAHEVLQMVGLAEAARARVSTYSLGMRQRLSLATALLGDPEVLVLDEPVNGLDPEGIRTVRHLIRGWAAEGRTVLVSSHLLAEMEQTVDDVVIIDHGKVVAAGILAAVVAGHDTLEDAFLARTGAPASSSWGAR